jgi:hypothetical protein
MWDLSADGCAEIFYHVWSRRRTGWTRLDRSPISHEDEFCVAVIWFWSVTVVNVTKFSSICINCMASRHSSSPSQYRVQWHNSTFGICPNMGSRLLPRARIVTTITSILIFSHSVFEPESRPRRNVFSVSGHYLLLAPAMFKNPKLSITFSYAEILTSTVFHNHIGIVWIMSASLCSSEILWSNYTVLCRRISKISMSNI